MEVCIKILAILAPFIIVLFLYYYRNILKGNEPVYQIVWAEPEDFKEVLISPVMLQDHMPDQVLSALKKVK